MADQSDTPTPTETERAISEIEIDADCERVWQALTTDDGLSAWFGPDSTIDPTDGGAISTPDIATGRPRVGYVTELEPERRLDFVWWPTDDPEQHSSVSITLTPRPSNGSNPITIVRVVEERIVPVPVMASALGTTSASVVASSLGNSAWAWRGAMLAVGTHVARV